MNDYERIARIIRYLDEHHTLQPGLDELAEIAGLSQFHCHRLFSAWAGVTPKDFLQFLTLEHVKALLREGQDVLSAALEAGLSGPGRLHDLCVSLEAMSPGELKSGGSGLNILFGFAATPFGDCLVGQSERGICHLAFVDNEGPDTALDELRNKWPEARLRRSDRTAAGLASRIFERPGRQQQAPDPSCVCQRHHLSGAGVVRPVARASRFPGDLRTARGGDRAAERCAIGRKRRGTEPAGVSHPLPPCHSGDRRDRRVPLGPSP